MKQLIYVLLFTLVLVACNTRNNKKEDSEKPLLTFNDSKFEALSKMEKAEKTKVAVHVPIAEGDSIVSKKINNRVFEAVKSIIGNNENNNTSNYADLIGGFINEYDNFVNETPDYPFSWSAEVEGKVDYSTPNILNIKLDGYVMAGGAHGNSYIISLLLDPNTGNELNLTDILTDTLTLSKIAEVKFRDKYDIPEDKPINSTGYMFPNDRFILPANIFISDEGLLLFYNTYEVAPYVHGQKEVMIPYEEIKEQLSSRLGNK